MRQGRGEEGTRLLHEAMTASLAGESRRPHTVVYTSCNLISACAQTAELDHARQWIRAADDFERRYGNPHLYTTCRTYLGAILFASGDWVDAERELRAALDIGASAEPAVCAEAAGQLAELRLAQGRLEEAERMLEGFENFETSSVVAARGLLPAWRRVSCGSCWQMCPRPRSRTRRFGICRSWPRGPAVPYCRHERSGQPDECVVTLAHLRRP